MKHLRNPVVTTPSRPPPPRQLAIAFEPRGRTMHAIERRRIVACLANLLMQAAGDATEEESSDDER
jgi:hypothetical protein